MVLSFYQNGIMRVWMDEHAYSIGDRRFRISQEELPVVDEQLVPIDLDSSRVHETADELIIHNLEHSDKSESYTYRISFGHFKITQEVTNNKNETMTTMVINPIDSLYYEVGQGQ
jgi:hypothetical protein